jgi:triosephosphate isomerase
MVFAYEPVWAIGTGKSAFPEQANDASRRLRALIGSRFNPEVAKKIRILYGGSVKPENVAEFMAEPDIDGVLVGGASLDPVKFVKIVEIGASRS